MSFAGLVVPFITAGEPPSRSERSESIDVSLVPLSRSGDDGVDEGVDDAEDREETDDEADEDKVDIRICNSVLSIDENN